MRERKREREREICTLRVIESKCGVQSLGRGARGGWHVSLLSSDMIY